MSEREIILSRLKEKPAKISFRVSQIVNAIKPYKTKSEPSREKEYIDVELKLAMMHPDIFGKCLIRPLITYKYKNVGIEGHPSFVCMKKRIVYLVRDAKTYRGVHEERSQLQLGIYRFLLTKIFGSPWKAKMVLVDFSLLTSGKEVEILFDDCRYSVEDIQKILLRWYKTISTFLPL